MVCRAVTLKNPLDQRKQLSLVSLRNTLVSSNYYFALLNLSLKQSLQNVMSRVIDPRAKLKRKILWNIFFLQDCIDMIGYVAKDHVNGRGLYFVLVFICIDNR